MPTIKREGVDSPPYFFSCIEPTSRFASPLVISGGLASARARAPAAKLSFGFDRRLKDVLLRQVVIVI